MELKDEGWMWNHFFVRPNFIPSTIAESISKVCNGAGYPCCLAQDEVLTLFVDDKG